MKYSQRYNIQANFEIDEGKLYNLLYMCIPMKGRFVNGNLYVYGFRAMIPKIINPFLLLDRYSFQVYDKSYFQAVYRFLRGDSIKKGNDNKN